MRLRIKKHTLSGYSTSETKRLDVEGYCYDTQELIVKPNYTYDHIRFRNVLFRGTNTDLAITKSERLCSDFFRLKRFGFDADSEIYI